MLRQEEPTCQLWDQPTSTQVPTQFASPTSKTADHQNVITAEHEDAASSSSEAADSATILKSLKFFEERVGGVLQGGPAAAAAVVGEGYREQLGACLDSILENTQVRSRVAIQLQRCPLENMLENDILKSYRVCHYYCKF